MGSRGSTIANFDGKWSGSQGSGRRVKDGEGRWFILWTSVLHFSIPVSNYRDRHVGYEKLFPNLDFNPFAAHTLPADPGTGAGQVHSPERSLGAAWV